MQEQISIVGVENKENDKEMKIAINNQSKSSLKTGNKRSQVKVACGTRVF
jgi:hypothetical protein